MFNGSEATLALKGFIKNMLRIFLTLNLFLLAFNSAAWNMQGHQVIAQIAYDHLTPKAKTMCSYYLKSRSKKSLNASFLAAAVWADIIRYRNVNWYDALHYIDIPFSDDNTSLPPTENMNAVWGIRHAISILSSKKANAFDKQMALFILIHVVGDIHQPLHAATQVSSRLPHGDLGGNLFPLGKNNIAENLHQYWDRGAGFFIGSNKTQEIINKAHELEQQWACATVINKKKPEQWAKSSHDLAVTQVYQINPNETPNKQYQLNAQNIAQKQALIAGCQLAYILNKLSE